MSRKIILLFVLLLAFILANNINAQILTSAADPALAGASIIDFEGQTVGEYTSLAVDNVTFIANDNHLRIDNQFSGNFNTTGLYLDNGYGDTGFYSLTMNFASPLDAFGFNWGASDFGDWELSAYDVSNSLLFSYTLPDVWYSNDGDFVGIAMSGISSATLINRASNQYDWVLIDNFHTAGDVIPEPGTIFLLGSGFLGLSLFGWLRRKK